MKSLTHDARGFVDGVVSHLKKGDKTSSATPKITSLLLKMSARARKERLAVVESAVKLTTAEQADIERFLERMAGHAVGLDSRINTDLIGGVRITMADWVLDASIRSQLTEMAKLLEGDKP